MSSFVPGLELNRHFYQEVVRPLLNVSFPDLSYTAALIGPGSEILGFDTGMSMDHDWGLRLFIFLKEEDSNKGDAITDLLSYQLPAVFAGFPVSFPIAENPKMRAMMRPMSGSINHHVIPITLRDFVRIQSGYDIAQPLHVTDWLTIPSHVFGELTAGAVYYDGIGELTTFRKHIVWYPHDVWLYLLASGWQRIGQEEHLMPRAGFVRDELGSALIGSRLVRDVMNLCFLMEKRYAPYAKWFGTAFKQLSCAEQLWPILWQVQIASTWREREASLVQIYEMLAHMHNALNVTEELPETVSPFYDRPFRVIHGEVFAQALVKQITDPEVQRIAARQLIGNINQWSDNTDIEGLEHARLRQLYE